MYYIYCYTNKINDQIKDLLINTDYTKTEIALLTNASDETVRRVNIGESYYDPKLTYPLR